MKKVILALLITIPILCSAQSTYKISGLVFKNTHNTLTHGDQTLPAMGTMVYAYVLKSDNDSTIAKIQKYTEAYAEYVKYYTSFTHSGKRVEGYQNTKKYRDGADSALSDIIANSKSVMVDAQGTYKIEGLALGNYLIIFYDNKLSRFNSNIPKKMYSPVLFVGLNKIKIEDSDTIVNYVYQFGGAPNRVF